VRDATCAYAAGEFRIEASAMSDLACRQGTVSRRFRPFSWFARRRKITLLQGLVPAAVFSLHKNGENGRKRR